MAIIREYHKHNYIFLYDKLFICHKERYNNFYVIIIMPKVSKSAVKKYVFKNLTFFF